MARSIPIIEARKKLTSLPEELEKKPGETLAITRRGKPVLALMGWELYESILETLEILGDEEMMRALREGIQQAADGKGIPWEEARNEI